MIASILVIMVPVPAELMDLLLAAQHHHRGDYAADDALRADAAGVQHLSLAVAGHDPVPAGAERGHHAADSYPGGDRRPVGGRRRGADVRPVRHRRRPRGPTISSSAWSFLDHRPDPIRGHHQGGHADQRGGRPIHPRRHAGQTDGDRRRSERRRDRPARGPAPPAGDHRSRPTSSGPWTVPASSSAATPSPAS